MKISLVFSRAIMAASSLFIPAEREKWMRAMQSEFVQLEEAHLSWASGCLFTTIKWRAQKEIFFASCVMISTFAILHLLTLLIFLIAAKSGFPSVGSIPSFWYLLLFCSLLTAFHPKRMWVISIAIFSAMVANTIGMFTFLSEQPMQSLLNARVLNYPFVIGLTILFAALFASAKLGQILSFFVRVSADRRDGRTQN